MYAAGPGLMPGEPEMSEHCEVAPLHNHKVIQSLKSDWTEQEPLQVEAEPDVQSACGVQPLGATGCSLETVSLSPPHETLRIIYGCREPRMW